MSSVPTTGSTRAAVAPDAARLRPGLQRRSLGSGAGMVVRALAFGVVWEICRLPDQLFHALSGVIHVASYGLPAQLATLAVQSPPVERAASAVDRFVGRWFGPLLRPLGRLWRSGAMAPVRRVVRRQVVGVVRTAWSGARLWAVSGVGRASVGVLGALPAAAVLLLVSAPSVGLVVSILAIGGAARWAFPIVDARTDAHERIEDALGRARARLEPRVRRVLGGRPAWLWGMLDRPQPLAPVEEVPSVPGDELRRLTAADARCLTERMVGPRPRWSTPHAHLWFDLRRTLLAVGRTTRSTPRGGAHAVWAVGDEGEAGALASAIARIELAQQEAQVERLSIGGEPGGRLDLGGTGEVVLHLVSALTRPDSRQAPATVVAAPVAATQAGRRSPCDAEVDQAVRSIFGLPLALAAVTSRGPFAGLAAAALDGADALRSGQVRDGRFHLPEEGSRRLAAALRAAQSATGVEDPAAGCHSVLGAETMARLGGRARPQGSAPRCGWSGRAPSTAGPVLEG